MVIGSGQLGKKFSQINIEDTIIFASGVSNSNCTDLEQFEREKRLMIDTLQNNKDKSFIYFSSCALSASDYKLNAYYQHKANMEEVVQKYSDSFYIFRIPQLFGDLKEHPTLVNFIYNSIVNDRKMELYSQAYRYVIDIEDVKILVQRYIEHGNKNIILDLANPWRYKVLDIVNILETLLHKKAIYEIVEKQDKYELNLALLQKFIEHNSIDVGFGKEYLYKKLQNRI